MHVINKRCTAASAYKNSKSNTVVKTTQEFKHETLFVYGMQYTGPCN